MESVYYSKEATKARKRLEVHILSNIFLYPGSWKVSLTFDSGEGCYQLYTCP